MDVSHLLDHLNPAQREAVSAPPGHYLVLAGAGSGKTRVLIHRIAWLNEVQGVPNHGIFAVTFTNKAAGEMRHRTDLQLRNGSRGMWIGTFHGLAHRLLRLHWQDARLPEGFQVMDSDDQLRLVKRVVQSLELDESKYPPKQMSWWINEQKDEGRRPQHIQPEPNDDWTEVRRQVYAAYQERCDRSGLLDFAELLLRAHELLRDTPALLAHYRARFREILVDEFQDTNAIQYAFVRVLAGESGNVFVVGDDDQAIYGWRGAKVENVQRFLKDFPGAQTVRLEQNYRSSANILGAANAVIAHNPDRIGKQLWTDSGDGDPIDLYAAYNEVDEARYVVEGARQWVRDGGSYGEVAVLYRSNVQSRALEEALISEQLPYRVYGGMRFFERAEIKDALAYLRLLTNRSDDAAFERAVNTPTRGIGDRTLDEVRRLARANALSLWEAAMLCTQQNTLAARARNALATFLSLVGQLHAETGEMELAERIDHVLMRSGLREHWAKESRGGLDSESRTENLDELVSVASRFTRPDDEDSQGMTELVAFLAYASLEAGEGQAQAGEEGVQLMTLHSAKGLEFPIVFLVGLEDGLFPSARSLEESGRLEEERRLAYVGITRARQKLVLCYAESRRIHGQDNYNVPSRFLREIPRDLLNEVRPKVQVSRTASLGATRGGPVHGVVEAVPIKLGANVEHPKFGGGVVVDYEGAGAHARVQVQFDEVGAKWLVMAYANLTVV
ncbi:DNA helicase II [Xanthomonas vasicola]|uniref:DNA helicase II n=1 Tax=Xanthomonas vasicola TaxID=56459 RepID=UPI0001CC0AD5|nr:DNA helicase II [Xanthomonas vasicola]KFA21185.1 DNA-dependent helicase II [Xanthomonas vasicola pv. musacearum NCPPB 4384]AZR32150.1 DNA helicase II [Xanthomonas vasicola pv. musacearum NCPPB 4379]KFA06886.1 DNA-dependent helicase II [Xanthomonas vasicola pv. musacearum NCPPB 2005]KFA13870.1 DNA-dependent helicase II [Xanthomonas vasicola pv. musacearum NCPPB 4380]KFA18328.1 DNA-dependent helicase II [Xanthomonas vasicola pv. musacearum NCPPB 4394]